MSRHLLIISLFALVIIACHSEGAATQVFDRTSNLSTPRIPVTSQGSFTGCGGAIIQPINPAFEQAIVEQTNAIRMQNGRSPLKRVQRLDESARYHAADMSINDYFNHDSYNRLGGKMSLVCDTWNRIEVYYKNWVALAENIAAGQHTPGTAMEGWMNSPDHKHNILSDSYREIGVGFYKGSGEYRYYWDQNFGRRDDVFPLIIAGEKAITHFRTVPIYIYGTWKEMRLRNNQDAWGNWVPFQTSFYWLLPANTGNQTVTAQLRDTKNSTTTSDSIQFEP